MVSMETEQEILDTVPDSWLRAVALATSSAEAGEAIRGILSEGVRMCGAAAGALVDLEARRCRATWGCDPAALEPLLGPDGAVSMALTGASPGKGLQLLSESSPALAAITGDSGRVVLTQLRMRDTPVGSLLLFYEGDEEPSPMESRSVHAVAGLLALVLESEFLAEDARRARQARDHFLTAIHHELRTPATALMLHAGLLQSGMVGELPPRLQKTVDRVQAEVAELVRVVSSVLKLAHLEAGALPVRTDLVNPRELVIDLLRRVEPTVNRKGLTLAVFVPRTLPVLQTDEERLRRVLLHLFANAIKFTDQGGIEVRVQRSINAPGASRRGPVLMVTVADTGPGIPEEEVQRVFEPFAQVEEGARTDSDVRGVGLGLPLARKLARSLGGEVVLESIVGEGTVATLLLPYHPGSPG